MRINPEINSLALKEALANEAFESYRFGEGVIIVDQSGWDSEDRDHFLKTANALYPEDVPFGDSHKISFHVVFGAAGEIEEVVAYDVDSGNETGEPGDQGQLALYRVTLIAEAICVTGNSEFEAAGYAIEDAREFIGEWNFGVHAVAHAEAGAELTSDLGQMDFDIELLENRGVDWAFNGYLDVFVQAGDPELAGRIAIGVPKLLKFPKALQPVAAAAPASVGMSL